MLDRKLLLTQPEVIKDMLVKRHMTNNVDMLTSLLQVMKTTDTELQELYRQKNVAARHFVRTQTRTPDTIAEGKRIKENIEKLEELKRVTEERVVDLELQLPNILDEDVQVGKDSSKNVCISRYLQQDIEDVLQTKSHDVLAVKFIDFGLGEKISGPKFSVLKNDMAKLERALMNWLMDTHEQSGYVEMSVPHVVNESSMFGTGAFPKFKEQAFQAGDKQWLIPTAEIPLTNLHRDEQIPEDQLPIKYVAQTRCFRMEVGASGTEGKGLIRQHEFGKVELFQLAKPEQTKQAHEEVLHGAIKCLGLLGLTYKVMLLCSGDTGFSSKKTYDVEFFMPGQPKDQQWREISSVSWFGDFQTRRTNTRMKKGSYLHTINGSALPLGRTLAAIIENNTVDGVFSVPSALVPYLNGQAKISLT